MACLISELQRRVLLYESGERRDHCGHVLALPRDHRSHLILVLSGVRDDEERLPDEPETHRLVRFALLRKRRSEVGVAFRVGEAVDGLEKIAALRHGVLVAALV